MKTEGKGKIEKLMMGLILFCACATVGRAVEATVQEDVKTAAEVKTALTRNIVYEPEFDAQGYSTPETSNHISLPTVTFGLNSADLTPMATQQLDQVVIALSELTAAAGGVPPRVVVEGHTCDRGAAEYNRRLSLRRAQSVLQYLMARGLPGDMFQARGWGEERPAAPNISERYRAQNRRVDFTLLRHESAWGGGTRNLAEGVTRERALLDVTFEAVKRNSGDRVLQNSAIRALSAGDRFRITFEALKGCHVYGLQFGADETVGWLLPLADDGEEPETGLWHYFGDKRVMPRVGSYYTLDAATGKFAVYIIAAPEPVKDLQKLEAIIAEAGTELTAETLEKELGNPAVELHQIVVDQR